MNVRKATYSEIRGSIRTGDVASVRGVGLISKLIMLACGCLFDYRGVSHTAAFEWREEALWIYEAKEGYPSTPRYTPASDWVADRQRFGRRVWHTAAPKEVRDNPAMVKAVFRSVRSKQYPLAGPIKVWLSRVLNKPIKLKSPVCSTVVQWAWESCGFTFRRTVNPYGLMVKYGGESTLIKTEGKVV